MPADPACGGRHPAPRGWAATFRLHPIGSLSPRVGSNQGVSVANQLHVNVVAVEERVWSGDAEMLVARTTEGEIGVLPGHAPLLGLLKEPSQVRVNLAGGERLTYDVTGGFLS